MMEVLYTRCTIVLSVQNEIHRACQCGQWSERLAVVHVIDNGKIIAAAQMTTVNALPERATDQILKALREKTVDCKVYEIRIGLERRTDPPGNPFAVLDRREADRRIWDMARRQPDD
jgi:hypothetical protein